MHMNKSQRSLQKLGLVSTELFGVGVATRFWHYFTLKLTKLYLV